MALWHGVEFYEKEKVVGEEYYQQWPNVSSVNIPINNNNFKLYWKSIRLYLVNTSEKMD